MINFTSRIGIKASENMNGTSTKNHLTSMYHSRGYLPHYDSGCGYQMITYRLADALPQTILQEIKTKKNSERKKRLEIEEHMDKGYGGCILAIPEVAEIVIKNWQWFDSERYELIAYVVMPNHVHLLIKVFDGESLTKIIHGWKSFTSKAIKKYLITADKLFALPVAKEYLTLISKGSTSRAADSLKIWQEDYWDRYIRSEEHYCVALEYIYFNPVKAGICQQPSDWKWSSLKYE